MSTSPSRRPGIGAILGVLALLVACSGTAFAAGVKITSSKQIKDNVVTSADIKNRTLKKGDLAPATVRALEPPVEKWRVLGTPGQPGLGSGWDPFADGYGTPAFRREPGDVVRLSGAASYGSDVDNAAEIFTLPAGYRPNRCVNLAASSFNGQGDQDPQGAVEVCPDGEVRVYADTDDRFVSLEGVTFTRR